ncbi:MAG: hypothetical protein NZM42_10405 [Gemmatales bacterium]|nr:hypothetical protein [Gemmatales bacterium]MDW8223937.1 hypothetical protein [Gemmatales bacterium]
MSTASSATGESWVPVADYRHLRPGQRVRITQTVRVGLDCWTTTVTGIFREAQVLVVGLSTERAADDVFSAPTIHFVKDNGELSSIVVDERTQIETLRSDS